MPERMVRFYTLGSTLLALNMLQESSAVSSESETDSGSRSKGSHPSATDLGKRVLFRSQHDKKEKYGTLR